MNEVIRQLYERKSVRAFTDRPIEESVVQAILRAAVMAPSAGNQQLYTILRITDPALKERLAESCDHQPFITRGKLALVFCADCLKWYDAFQSVGCAPRTPGPGDLLLAVDDALIAAQNAVVAAESFGIGSCYIGDIMENIETQTFSSMLQLLLYLCSDEPDMPEIEHPQKRRRLSGGVRSPEAPRVWDVGVRISTAIRNYRAGEVKHPWGEAEGESHGHASPRPHVRSAHWHTYWTGPREAMFPEKKPVMRWIPPLPIGMNGRRELPTNIRMVE